MGNQLSLFDMINKLEDDIEQVNDKVTTSENKDIIIKTIDDDKKFYLNEEVIVSYLGELYRGIVKSIYNNNMTLNCIFDEGSKHTAFHISKVFKIEDN